MSRFLSSVFVSLALVTPVALQGQDSQDHQNKRYYDSTHKDYHEWNANEDQKYHQYLKDNHKKDHDWSKASKKQQDNYWNSRHEHPDSH
jgi:type III secretory pathway component EscR